MNNGDKSVIRKIWSTIFKITIAALLIYKSIEYYSPLINQETLEQVRRCLNIAKEVWNIF